MIALATITLAIATPITALLALVRAGDQIADDVVNGWRRGCEEIAREMGCHTH